MSRGASCVSVVVSVADVTEGTVTSVVGAVVVFVRVVSVGVVSDVTTSSEVAPERGFSTVASGFPQLHSNAAANI